MKEIVQDGAEALREIALPVPEEMFNSPELARLVRNMEEALDREHDGVALAAPQVGVSYRLFIVRRDRTVLPLNASSNSASSEFPAKQKILAPQIELYINPEIIKHSRKRTSADEGCLSVRAVYGTT